MVTSITDRSFWEKNASHSRYRSEDGSLALIPIGWFSTSAFVAPWAKDEAGRLQVLGNSVWVPRVRHGSLGVMNSASLKTNLVFQ